MTDQAIRLIDISPAALKEMADWYKTHTVPRAFHGVHPMILAYVERATRGDWRRCGVDKNGSVTIYNYPVWGGAPAR